VLGSLLGACQRCRNADVGGRVIQLFLEMELSNSGKYVILSKIYANMRRWDDFAKTRVLMRQCGVSKTLATGLTLDLVFMNFILEFHSGDNLNHHSVNIYQFLNEEMKREGLHSKYWLHIEVEKLKTWLPLSAIEQCIRSDYIFWLLTPAKILNGKLCS
jgi:hypothetical protein